MTRLFTNKTMLFSVLLSMVVLSVVFFSYAKASAGCKELKSCCQKIEQRGAEMPWESISKHFVSAVFFR
jgi:hypothetical protein